MKVSIVFVVLAVLATGSFGWEPDCTKVDDDAKAYVEDKVANSKVYLIGLTYCGWCTRAKSVIGKMGFNDDDVIVDNLDDDKFKDDKIAIINYVYCKHSQMKTVPQVFINKKFVGGYTDTRHHYYTGEGTRAAYYSRSILGYANYLAIIKQAAIDFVDEGTARSAGGKYFVLSKTRCGHCFKAKDCLKAVGVPSEDIELYEINTFYTHDEIKRYKGRLTGSSYTPYLAYNGKTIKNHAELVAAAKCPA